VEVLCTDVGDGVEEKSDRGKQADVRLKFATRSVACCPRNALVEGLAGCPPRLTEP
jgi:hypothetical protein